MPGIKDFRDKVVVITGAGSGIGRATAHAFATEGAELVLADIDLDRLRAVAKEIGSDDSRVLTREVDVAEKEQVGDLAEFVMEKKAGWISSITTQGLPSAPTS